MKTLLGTLLNSSSSTSNSILAHYNDVKPPYITGAAIISLIMTINSLAL